MKTSLTVAAVAALAMSLASVAEAQVVVSTTWAPSTVVAGPTYYSSAYVPPYSYYAALPFPARGYVPYGSVDEYPFYGQPYGHPYDRWTWPYLSGGYNAYLSRYYYPPVR